jgi:hypothetical protein
VVVGGGWGGCCGGVGTTVADRRVVCHPQSILVRFVSAHKRGTIVVVIDVVVADAAAAIFIPTVVENVASR